MANWTKNSLAIELQIAHDKQFMPLFAAAAKKYDMPIALLLAIASRESNMGKGLDTQGKGDRGYAWGIMQIDRRAHPTFTNNTSPFDHAKIVDYGGKVWADNYKQFNDILLATIAYNRGAGNVRKSIKAGQNPDNGYGVDTLNRMRVFEELLGGGNSSGNTSKLNAVLNVAALVGMAGIGYALESGMVKVPNLLKLVKG